MHGHHWVRPGMTCASSCYQSVIITRHFLQPSPLLSTTVPSTVNNHPFYCPQLSLLLSTTIPSTVHNHLFYCPKPSLLFLTTIPFLSKPIPFTFQTHPFYGQQLSLYCPQPSPSPKQLGRYYPCLTWAEWALSSTRSVSGNRSHGFSYTKLACLQKALVTVREDNRKQIHTIIHNILILGNKS